jgi:hypothetical protein
MLLFSENIRKKGSIEKSTYLHKRLLLHVKPSWSRVGIAVTLCPISTTIDIISNTFQIYANPSTKYRLSHIFPCLLMIDGVKWNSTENLVNIKIYLICCFSLISEVTLTYKEIRLIWHDSFFIQPCLLLSSMR